MSASEPEHPVPRQKWSMEKTVRPLAFPLVLHLSGIGHTGPECSTIYSLVCITENNWTEKAQHSPTLTGYLECVHPMVSLPLSL